MIFQVSVFLRGLCGEINGSGSRGFWINHRGHGEAQRNSVQILISGPFSRRRNVQEEPWRRKVWRTSVRLGDWWPM